MDAFGQRMTVVMDYLSDNQPSGALTEIIALEAKKKVLDKLSTTQRRTLILIKSLCLAKVNNYGEAEQLFE